MRKIVKGLAFSGLMLAAVSHSAVLGFSLKPWW
jgi:hypothetical protein